MRGFIGSIIHGFGFRLVTDANLRRSHVRRFRLEELEPRALLSIANQSYTLNANCIDNVSSPQSKPFHASQQQYSPKVTPFSLSPANSVMDSVSGANDSYTVKLNSSFSDASSASGSETLSGTLAAILGNATTSDNYVITVTAPEDDVLTVNYNLDSPPPTVGNNPSAELFLGLQTITTSGSGTFTMPLKKGFGFSIVSSITIQANSFSTSNPSNVSAACNFSWQLSPADTPPPPPPPPTFNIDYVSDTTFIATDAITLHASSSTFAPGLDVKWTVEGTGAAAGIPGFPANIDTKTDATGGVSFTFRPSDDPYFVENRQTQWTRGSLVPNTPIGFSVKATITNGNGFQSTVLTSLLQDEIDTVREEYYDYATPFNNAVIPTRYEFVPSLGPVYNWGNYSVQINNNLPLLYSKVLADYQGMQVTVSLGGKQYTTNIPMNARLTINSAYRDPQHNKAIGSHVPFSQHTLGSALDLKPEAVAVVVMVGGKPQRVTLSPDQVLYPALLKAAKMVGVGSFAQAESKRDKVPVGTPGEDHIHVQW